MKHTALGFGAVFVNSPVWIGETVRPELRGFFLCFMNGSIVLAQLILSSVFWALISRLYWQFASVVLLKEHQNTPLTGHGNWSLFCSTCLWVRMRIVILWSAFLIYSTTVPLLAFYIWFPESPYFLLKKNQSQKARRSLERIHGSNDQLLIDAEMERIQENVQFSENSLAQARLGGPLLFQAFQGTNRVFQIPSFTSSWRSISR